MPGSAGAASRFADAEVRYRSVDGSVDSTLGKVDAAAVLAGGPVRSFPTYKGQRNRPGLLWTATTGTLVGYESLLERDRLWLADFDPAVRAIAGQPFWLSGLDGSTRRRHVPDFMLRLADGSCHRFPIRQSVQGLQDQHRRGNIGRNRRPAPTRREQIGEQRLREQHPAVLGQQLEHAAPVNQMPSDRFGIQQLTLVQRTTLHQHMVSTLSATGQDDTLCSAQS